MTEYIEREAALAAVDKTYLDYFSVVQAAVLNIPADDVAPVVHGRWKASGVLLECQNCGEIYSRLGGNGGKAWNYCPNCGARMDDDSDD